MKQYHDLLLKLLNKHDYVDKGPRENRTDIPTTALKINGEFDSVLDIKFDDIELIGYQHHPFIKAPVAV